MTLRALHHAGLPEDWIRWLVAEQVVQHFLETTQPGQPGRTFEAVPNLCLHERSCFLLTPHGLDQARRYAVTPGPAQGPAPLNPSAPGLALPVWRKDIRELSWAGYLVKHFRHKAPHQELILDAFQEEDWPSRIDDPLTGGDDPDRWQRLHDATKNLNGHQVLSPFPKCCPLFDGKRVEELPPPQPRPRPARREDVCPQTMPSFRVPSPRHRPQAARSTSRPAA